MQISQSEPAVRHAVLAVSSLHEGLMTATVGGATQSFALQQYNKSIAHLLDQMNNSLVNPLASLLTCVLFVCIEFLQGKDKESLIHLEQGRQLLTRLEQRPNNPEMGCIVRYIVPQYTRLSLTSFLFGASPVPIPDFLTTQREFPDTFEAIDDLRASMHEFMEQAFRFAEMARPVKNSSGPIPREKIQVLEVEQDRLLSRVGKLNVAFSLFRASRSNPGSERTLLILQMYLHAQHIWISTALSSSEVVYDDYLPSFAAIVPLVAAYLDLETSSQPESKLSSQSSIPPAETSRHLPGTGHQIHGPRRNFAFETHIIPPLYYVATKCRHPLIRRSALDLLRRNPFRRENLWRASVMGALAGHIVSLEEAWSLSQDASATLGPICTPRGSHMPISRVYHNAQSSGLAMPQNFRHNDLSRAMLLHPNIISTEETPAGLPVTSSITPLPELSFEDFDADQTMGRVIDLGLHIDGKISASLSQTPSLTSSIDECSPSSTMEPAMAIFHSPSNDTSAWQQSQLQLQRDYRQHGSYHPVSRMDSFRRGSYNHAQNQAQQLMSLAEQSGTMMDCVSYPSSEASSTLPAPPSLHRQQAHIAGNHIQGNLITEAPFGLPEELRVHDAIVGPERGDGSWVAVFRKLHGVDADWDVQADRAPAVQPGNEIWRL